MRGGAVDPRRRGAGLSRPCISTSVGDRRSPIRWSTRRPPPFRTRLRQGCGRGRPGSRGRRPRRRAAGPYWPWRAGAARSRTAVHEPRDHDRRDDHDVAGDDDDREPARQRPHHGERHVDGDEERLVGERIEIGAELAAHVEAPGDDAVGRVREGRKPEDGEGRGPAALPIRTTIRAPSRGARGRCSSGSSWRRQEAAQCHVGTGRAGASPLASPIVVRFGVSRAPLRVAGRRAWP